MDFIDSLLKRFRERRADQLRRAPAAVIAGHGRSFRIVDASHGGEEFVLAPGDNGRALDPHGALRPVGMFGARLHDREADVDVVLASDAEVAQNAEGVVAKLRVVVDLHGQACAVFEVDDVDKSAAVFQTVDHGVRRTTEARAEFFVFDAMFDQKLRAAPRACRPEDVVEVDLDVSRHLGRRRMPLREFFADEGPGFDTLAETALREGMCRRAFGGVFALLLLRHESRQGDRARARHEAFGGGGGKARVIAHVSVRACRERP